MDTRPDEMLLAAHNSGDPMAFTSLVERHMDHLWAVAITTLANHEDAADALQDALLRIFRGIEQFRGESALATWMHRIVVNVCLDRLRQQNSRPTAPLVVDIQNPTDPIGAVERRIDVAQALATLPFDQRAAVTLVDLHGMPIREAAELLNVPDGTVKSRCFRGRIALSRLLAPAISGDVSGNQMPGSDVQSSYSQVQGEVTS